MNTLKYAKQLEETGFSREQAEMTIGILNEIVESNLASKQDLRDLSNEMSAEFKSVRNEMSAEFKAIRSEMAAEFKAVRAETALLGPDLMIKMGKMLFAALTLQLAALSAILKFLIA